MMADPEDASVHRPPAAGLPSARPPGSTPAASDPVTESGTVGAVSVQDQLARSIIRSKVQPPPVRASTLERPRLLQWLASHSAERLILVNAEAGYGKTTLLADFARRSAVRCLWYRLDATDRDWVTFINYMIAAVREVEPDFGAATAGLLTQMAVTNVPLDVVLDSLISELPSIGPAPTLLMLDDFHAVDDAPDIHTILSRLFERAPQALGFVLAGRVAPSVRTGRLAAHGQVARLDTDDLRFSGEETADLFALAYQLPLEPDLVEEIDARAEGWAASLQLVYSSIRHRRPSEARAFIQSLSGAEGDLYDYLAEEVLAGLTPHLKRVLVRASLLERVVPSYVMAIVSAEPDPPTLQHLATLLDDADSLGFMGRTAAGASARRFHPLLKSYLRDQLERETDEALRERMHLRVAEVAESADWPTAVDHYIHGHKPEEAMRVLADSATNAFGNGEFRSVVRFVDRMPHLRPPLAVQAVRARALLATQGDRAAQAFLETLNLDGATEFERSLVAFARASTFFAMGDLDRFEAAVRELLNNSFTSEPIRDIATAWTVMMRIADGLDFAEAGRTLASLAERQAQAGLHFHAAITFHNAMGYFLASGRYQEALRLGDRAVAAYRAASPGSIEFSSTLATMATALFESGSEQRALELSQDVMAAAEAHTDAYADAAYLACLTGDLVTAERSLRSAQEALRRGLGDAGGMYSVGNADAMIGLAKGDLARARTAVRAELPAVPPDPELVVRRLMTQAVVAVVSGDPQSSTLAAKALDLATRQGAGRYIPRLNLLLVAASGHPDELAVAVDSAAASGALALIEVADAVATALPPFQVAPRSLTASIQAWPNRWLPILRRQLAFGNTPNAHAAASLLARFGTAHDVPLVVAFERTYIKGTRARMLGRELLSRTSPRLTIHDLGRMQYELNDQSVPLSQTRRKAASLLTFLITRPNLTATKEQVIEHLWPDLDVASALNSFNQTLFFLRRDIDQWYDVATSPEYVVNESELVWLDRGLVEIDSLGFYETAAACPPDRLSTLGPSICERYIGRFAPEFEYDEWAIGWRERLHAAYLNMVSGTARSLVAAGNYSRALQVLQDASRIDPDSMDLEPALIWVYGRLGATAAAVEQYRRLSGAHRTELGIEAPPFASIVAGEFPLPPS